MDARHAWRRLKRRTVCHLARRFEFAAPLLPAAAPLRALRHSCGEGARELLVFLPGLSDFPEDYERNGFIDAVRDAGMPLDIAAADMHFGYYLRRTALERLREDIVLPARAAGYERVSLAGISLGGFGALYYAAHHSDEIARLFLLAPYLGEPRMIEEIAAAGGIERWNPRPIAADDHARRLWRWLKNYRVEKNPLPELYLGYGLRDSFAPANALLAELLPAERVRTIPGGHDWPTWRDLWRELMRDAPRAFARRP